MDPFEPKGLRPEAIIQNKIVRALRYDGWFVKVTFGNAYQTGFADLFAAHPRYGCRWIEVKTLKGRLEASQIENFTKLSEKRIGVWVLTSDCSSELRKLMIPGGNWFHYLDIMKPVTRDRASKAKPYEPPKKLGSVGPERLIQEELKEELGKQGWYSVDTHGNTYSNGLPDVYIAHRDYGARWLEVKNPRGYHFTPAQLETFPLMEAHGAGVWILTDVIQIPKLMGPPNWRSFLDRHRDITC